jgi:hypothetical protein
MSSLLVGKGGAVLATASAIVNEVGVLGFCALGVATVLRLWDLVIRSSDYRSDDRVGALVGSVWTGRREESAGCCWWEVAAVEEKAVILSVGEEGWRGVMMRQAECLS